MPRLKDFEDVDVDELEDAEYTEGGSFSNYDGEEPPKGTVLRGFVKKLWLSETRNDDPMLVALFEAAGNEDDEEQYNGWATWEYLALIATAKFRWAPFFEVTGIALRDIIGKKSRLWVEEDNDNFGVPIEKIGDWVPGEDNDDAWVQIITRVETKGEYKGRAKIDKWLHWDDEGSADDDGDEDSEPEEVEEPEEVQEPEPTPARTRSTRSTARSASSAAKPATASRAATAKPAATPAARSSRGRASAAKPAAAATAPAGRGRTRAAKGSTEEPPF